ncbi:MAG: ABC transporter permease [Deltaproteobacteria bacterium]|nr:ABC transporter permease [Deltaproteobacteria bacterium]MBI3079774.1 ABC transporter permease [Deltaproteobacteria bacterium]
MAWTTESRWNGVLVLLAVFPLWELLSRAKLLHPLFFPPMTRILRALGEIMLSGNLPGHIVASLQRAAAGYFLAAAVFITLGILMGYWQRLYNLFELVIELARPVPPPALIPVAILFFGIGNEMKVFIIFFSCAWPILINTIDGVRGVDRVLVNTALTFGLGRFELIRKIIIPAASPYIMTGLRISVAISLILVVISEMVGSTDGIGYFILNAQRSFEIPEMYAGMIVLAALGYTLNRVFVLVDGRLMGWHKGLTARLR